MARADFWCDVWVRNPLREDGVSPPDVQHITADALDEALQKKIEWQFIGPLRGFDVADADFDFLPEVKRDELLKLVRDYNELAVKLKTLVNRQRTSAGDAEETELANRARPLLRDIILSLQMDRYFSWDAWRYGKLVEQELAGQLPEGVVDLRFATGQNSWDEPALWVWTFLSDETTATDEQLIRFGRPAREAIRAALMAAVPDRQAYISFRGVSERVEEEVAA